MRHARSSRGGVLPAQTLPPAGLGRQMGGSGVVRPGACEEDPVGGSDESELTSPPCS
jgi:hypothetical protein